MKLTYMQLTFTIKEDSPISKAFLLYKKKTKWPNTTICREALVYYLKEKGKLHPDLEQYTKEIKDED